MSTVSIDYFEEILKEDELPADAIVLMSAIFNEIKEFTTVFLANSNDIINKAAEHSITYNCLPEESKRFLDSVMTLPLCICYGSDEGDAINEQY
jgi:hypothetical protein